MRVLLVTERYWPEVGAAPSRLANMAEGLKRYGADVDVLTSLPNYPKGRIFDGYRGCMCKKECHGGVNIFRYWIYATVSRSPIARVLNMFSFAVMIWLFAFRVRKCLGYDVVIIQTPALVVAKSAMVLFKGLYGRRCVLNVSDIWPLTAVDMGAMRHGSLSHRYMCGLERYLYKKADGVMGQSEEILNHVKQELLDFEGKWNKGKDDDQVLNSDLWKSDKHLFLYRNLQKYENPSKKSYKQPLKIVFCGMLGVAQDVAGIVKNVPFKDLGVEFHILGGGKQLQEIQDFIAEHPDCNVFAHGFVAKEEISNNLIDKHASVVPLSTRIRGAVPSKVFDLLPQGLPVLFCGGGEAASFVLSRKVGYVAAPGDYSVLVENIVKLRSMGADDYEKMSERCLTVSREELQFDEQMEKCYVWLSGIC